MVRVKGAILALIWMCQLNEFSRANKTLDVQHKKLDFPAQELVYSYESYLDGIDVYAACRMVENSDERMCKVVREKTPHSRDIQSCDVALRLDNRTANGNKNNDKIVVVPLGKDHAVFYLIEEGKNASVKFNVVNFDGCKIAEKQITIMNPDHHPKHAVILVPYSDSFDVYYRDSNKCGDKRHCRITINAEGKILSGPDTPIDTNLHQSFPPYIVPISIKPRDKGIFYMKHVNGSLSEYDFIVHKPNGVEKSLGKHKVYSDVVQSTVNDLIGVCFLNDLVNATVNCTQYEDSGNLKFNVEVLNGNDSSVILHVRNLPEGGFLLLTGKCTKQPNCGLDEADFLVIKLNSAGKKVGSLKLNKLEFESGIKGIKLVPSFYKNKENKYCSLITQYKSTDTGHRDLGHITSTTACFTDEDFSE